MHWSVTESPTAAWVVQQLREAFPFDETGHGVRYLLFDRDSSFSAEVVTAATSMALESVRTSYQSPWQNGVAERLVGTVRGDLLDYAIVLGDEHLSRLDGGSEASTTGTSGLPPRRRGHPEGVCPGTCSGSPVSADWQPGYAWMPNTWLSTAPHASPDPRLPVLAVADRLLARHSHRTVLHSESLRINTFVSIFGSHIPGWPISRRTSGRLLSLSGIYF